MMFPATDRASKDTPDKIRREKREREREREREEREVLPATKQASKDTSWRDREGCAWVLHPGTPQGARRGCGREGGGGSSRSRFRSLSHSGRRGPLLKQEELKKSPIQKEPCDSKGYTHTNPKGRHAETHPVDHQCFPKSRLHMVNVELFFVNRRQ